MRFTLHSKLVGRDPHEVLVLPADSSRRVMLVLLHGYHAGPAQFLSQPFFDALASLRGAAPNVLLLDGGQDSYWHDRADGKWASMVLREAIPAGLHHTGAEEVAIGGISMGGYGALLLGSRHRFCAVAVQSPALWLEPGDTAPGAFDNAQDYERNDVFKLRPPRPLWIALGASDPFYDATLAYAKRAGVTAQVGPGGHDLAFWDAHMPALLGFVARACS